ncbi:MAG: IS21-like element helper ATPase IstB [Candidatus Eremiobacterota bacterium]
MEHLMKKLALPRMRAVYREWIDRAGREGMSYSDFLRGLLEEEVCAREESRLRNLMKNANFPFEKTLEQFDFKLHPELRRQIFQNYLEEDFVREGRSLVMVGAPGLGKSHISVAIGIKMVQRGFDVRFITVQRLVNQVLSAETAKEKDKVLRPYRRAALLILDEFGYLVPEPETGPVLYELISERYEKKATIITSNKSLTEWGKIIQDNSLASALLDRLMHHGEVYYLKGESYRLKGKEKLLGQQEAKPSDEDEKNKNGK